MLITIEAARHPVEPASRDTTRDLSSSETACSMLLPCIANPYPDCHPGNGAHHDGPGSLPHGFVRTTALPCRKRNAAPGRAKAHRQYRRLQHCPSFGTRPQNLDSTLLFTMTCGLPLMLRHVSVAHANSPFLYIRVCVIFWPDAAPMTALYWVCLFMLAQRLRCSVQFHSRSLERYWCN